MGPALLPILAFGAAGAASKLLAPKPKAAPAPTLAPRRDQARESALERDRVSKRRGVAANMILGASGAESSAGGGKTALGS